MPVDHSGAFNGLVRLVMSSAISASPGFIACLFAGTTQLLIPLLKQSVAILSLRVIGTGLSLCTSILIARLMGAEALGVYSYVLIILTIAAIPITNGWATLLVRETARTGKISGSILTIGRMGMIGAFITAVAAMLAGGTALEYSSIGGVADALRPIALPAIMLLAATMVFDQMAALRMAKLRGINLPAFGQLPETIVRPAMICAGVLGFSLLLGTRLQLIHLFIAVALASFASAVVGQFLLRPKQAGITPVVLARPYKRAIFASAMGLAASAGLAQINGYIDILLLARFAPVDQIGHYRAALQLAILANFGFMALNFLAGQRFSRYIGDGDRKGLSASAKNLSRVSLLTAAPVAILLGLFGPEIFSRLFGPEFAPSATPALFIATGFATNAFFGMPYTMLIMDNHEKLVVRLTFLALVVNAGLCLILIPKFGINGAGASNMLAITIWSGSLWALAKLKMGIDTSSIGLKPNAIAERKAAV